MYFELVMECLMAEECTWSMATFAGFILSLFGSKDQGHFFALSYQN
jgi:hypothetical protein